MAFSSSRAFIFYLNNCKNIVKARNIVSNNSSIITNIQNVNKRLYSTQEVFLEQKEIYNMGLPKKKISKAMQMYLQRSKEHNEFMQKERIEYKIGKRHLANMMGENPDNFTEDDVKRAIEYLFPSGIFDQHAKPVMKPPDEIFPPRKAAQFDESGRPFHSMFYTCRPNFYQTIHSIAGEIYKLNKREDSLHLNGLRPDANIKINLDTSVWLTKAEFEKHLLEEISDEFYEYFLNTAQRLADHPLAHEASDCIMKYRKPLMGLMETAAVLPIEYDSDGRPFVTVKGCCRKSARGTVVLRGNGSGQITINGQDITYFNDWTCREQVIFPLIFTGLENDIDVEATVQFGGTTGQSGAIRWGISWGLRSFVDSQMIQKMKVAGLLTRDWRTRERKKPGQEGSRRKFTWKKR